MSEKPVVKREHGGRLDLNDLAKDMVRRFAAEYGLDSGTVLADVERGLPAARLLLAVVGLSLPAVKNGRPANDEQFKVRYFAISAAIAKFGEPEGIKAAAANLKISESTARTIRNGRVNKNGNREGGIGRAYWEPPVADEDC